MSAEKEPSGIAQMPDAAGVDARLDAATTAVLTIRRVIAWILHLLIPEFLNLDVDYIERNCIGTPAVRTVPLHEDTVVSGSGPAQNAADASEFFQVLIDICYPEDGRPEPVRMIFDFEVLDNWNLDYTLERRAVYHGVRGISMQQEPDDASDECQGLKKFRTVFICPRVAPDRAGFISHLSTNLDIIGADNAEEPEPYDPEEYQIMEEYIIYLDDPVRYIGKGLPLPAEPGFALPDSDTRCELNWGWEDVDPVVQFLSILFGTGLTDDLRKWLLEGQYGMPMEAAEKVSTMCTLGAACWGGGIEAVRQ